MIGNWHPSKRNHLRSIMGVKKMWNSSWQESLAKTLPALIRKPTNSVALVGIGNPLKGDDASGLVTIHRLQEADLPDNLYRIDSGAVPENCTGILRKIQPALVIFIDAADMGMKPGGIGSLQFRANRTGFLYHPFAAIWNSLQVYQGRDRLRCLGARNPACSK